MSKIKHLHWFFKVSIVFWVIVFIGIGLIVINDVLPTKVVEDGEIRGLIVQNQIWRGNVQITGDIYALPTTTIAITPGAKIVVKRRGDKNNYDYLPWHLKNGVNTGKEEHGIEVGRPFWDEREKIQVRLWRISAIGNPDQPIAITSDDPNGSSYDINLIRFEKGELSYVNLSNYRRLEIGQDVLIKNSTLTFSGECAVCIKRGTPTIEDNVFENAERNFIEVILASPHIKGNSFLNDKGSAVVFNGINQSEVRLSNNIFHVSSDKAISILSNNVGGMIQGNLFEIGDIELPCYSKVKIESNHIKSKIRFRNPESCQGEYAIGPNFWETSDIEIVKNTKFIGQSSNFRVIVPKILDQSPKEP